jgi:hypothetical protein
MTSKCYSLFAWSFACDSSSYASVRYGTKLEWVLFAIKQHSQRKRKLDYCESNPLYGKLVSWAERKTVNNQSINDWRMAFRSEGSFTFQRLTWSCPPFWRSYPQDPWFSLLKWGLAKKQYLHWRITYDATRIRAHDFPLVMGKPSTDCSTAALWSNDRDTVDHLLFARDLIPR